MKKLILYLCLLFSAQSALATLAIDGTPITGSSATQTVTLTPTGIANTNDIIVNFIGMGAGALNTLSGVSDSSTLTWNAKNSGYTGPSDRNCYIYWALSTGVYSGTITDTMNSAASYSIRPYAVAISGANTSSPWDTNASLNVPAIDNTGSATSNSYTFSTTNANTIVFAYLSSDINLGGISGPAGWVDLATGSTAYAVYYKIFSSPQSNVTIGFSWANASKNAINVVAIQDPSGGAPPAYTANSLWFLR